MSSTRIQARRGGVAALVSLLVLALLALVPAAALASPKAANRSSSSPPAAHLTARSGPTYPSVVPGSPPAGKLPKGVKVIGELPSLRTASSDTYLTTSGARVAVIYPGRVNYPDASGALQPIDDTAVASAAGWHNAAGPYAASLPANLASPVTISVGGQRLSLRLVGASGSGASAGDGVTYQDVLAHTSVSYRFTNTGVKESLLLDSPSAPSTFTWTIEGIAGLVARAAPSGAIALLDRAGHVVATLAAPDIEDAHHLIGPAPTMSVSGDRLSLSLAPDAAWLAKASRAYPVVVDPSTITLNGPYSDCDLTEDSPSVSLCQGNPRIHVGWNGYTGTEHAMVRFDGLTSAVPYDSLVLNSLLYLYVEGADNANDIPVSISSLTRPWTESATWDTYDGTHAWTTPGGDANPLDDVSPLNLNNSVGWAYWDPTEAVQAWVAGEHPDGSGAPNDGFLLTSTSTANSVAFTDWESTSTDDWPYLAVVYMPRTGGQTSPLGGAPGASPAPGKAPSPGQAQGPLSLLTTRLSDRANVSVNPANGNLVEATSDLHISGVGLPISIDHVYNSLGAPGDLGSTPWALTPSESAPYLVNYEGSVALVGGSAIPNATFISNGGEDYASAIGLHAVLHGDLSSGYTLTFDGSGEVWTFDTPASPGSHTLLITSKSDRNGNTISYAYGSSGQLTSITDTEGRVVTIARGGPSGAVSSITDPTGRQVSFSYDSSGRLASVKDAAGGVTTYAYDSAGNLDEITDALGHITTMAYDSAHRVTSLTRVTDNSTLTGPTTTYDYHPGSASSPTSGNTVVTDPNGHQTTYAYDAFDRVTSVTDALGHTRSTSYTPNSDVASLTDAMATPGITAFSYDVNANLTKVTAPATASGQAPASVSLGYQTPSTVTGGTYLASSVTDAQGNCTAYTYDTAGNLLASYAGQSSPCDGQTGGTASTNAYQGDSGVSCGAKAGELCSSTDGDGNTTTYGYDASGNLTSITPPSPRGATTISYDGLSRPTTISTPTGSLSVTYDNLDRVTELSYSDGKTISFTYDADGNLTERVDSTGTTTFTYDSLGRLVSESLPGGADACAGSNPPAIVLTYDAASNLASYCDAGGTTAYGYDAANEVTSLAEPGGSCVTSPTSLCTTFSYDADGRRTTTTFPGGAILAASYDPAGNQTTAIGKDASANVLTSFAYTYAQGTADTALRQSVTEADAMGSGTTTYSYDSMNRLTGATGGSRTYTYAYDPAGNLCSTTSSTCSGAYTYNAANELTSGPAGSYAWDSSGQLTSSPALTNLAYDAAHQTTSITPAGGSVVPMAYAGVGQFLRTQAGSITFANGPLGLAASTDASGTSYFVRDPQGNVIGERTPDGSHWYFLKDGLGSVTAVIDASGYSVPDRFSYDPYGNVVATSGGSVAAPFGFASGYHDASTGLTKFGTRYYDPAVGRWTQPDPIAGSIVTPDTLNPYLYVGDDPVNFVDPSGYSLLGDIVGAAVSFFGGGVGAAVGVSGGFEYAIASGLAGTLLGAAGVATGALLLGGAVILGATIAANA